MWAYTLRVDFGFRILFFIAFSAILRLSRDLKPVVTGEGKPPPSPKSLATFLLEQKRVKVPDSCFPQVIKCLIVSQEINIWIYDTLEKKFR